MTAKLLTLEQAGISLAERGANIPKDLTFEQAENAVALLTRLGGSVKWALADVIAASLGKFGEQYAQLIDTTQLSQGSLQNILYTYRRFPTHESRAYSLSFSHYTAVAVDYLESEDRAAILQQAVDEGLSREQVRDIVRGYGPEIVVPAFSKEAFISRLDHLIGWAESNGAPSELLDSFKEIFSDFKRSSEWDF